MSSCHKFNFFYPCIFAIRSRRHLSFQTMNFVRSNNINLKYCRFTSAGCKDIVAKTNFLYSQNQMNTKITYQSKQLRTQLDSHEKGNCSFHMIIRAVRFKFKKVCFVPRLDTDQRSRVSTERRQLNNGGLNYATKVQNLFL